jgi:hypothetical protein
LKDQALALLAQQDTNAQAQVKASKDVPLENTKQVVGKHHVTLALKASIVQTKTRAHPLVPVVTTQALAGVTVNLAQPATIVQQEQSQACLHAQLAITPRKELQLVLSVLLATTAPTLTSSTNAQKGTIQVQERLLAQLVKLGITAQMELGTSVPTCFTRIKLGPLSAVQSPLTTSFQAIMVLARITGLEEMLSLSVE